MLRLSCEHLDTMIRHARAEAPNEACGLLAGRNDSVSAVHCLPNACHSPVEYELTAGGYMLALDLDEAGQLLGSFHSHPRSAAYPSPVDQQKAFWPFHMVIVSLASPQPVLRAFRVQHHGRGLGQADALFDRVEIEEVAIEVT